MKFKIFAIVLSVLFAAAPVLSSTFNEIEPNGCITLVDGGDQYQVLVPGDALSGTIGLGDDEACLYFDYQQDGIEYIEDLYALNIAQGGDYSITLSHAGTQDLDLYLYDFSDPDNAVLLNPADCGEFYCGITCGTPEIVNVHLDAGIYVIGVSLSSVYYCGEPYDTAYVLTAGNFTGRDKPVVDKLTKAGDPFRIFIYGYDFSDGVKVYIAGSEWQNFTLNGSEMIKLKKGSSLKAKFPKDGSWIPITIVNPGNAATSIEYNRRYNQWREAGLR